MTYPVMLKIEGKPCTVIGGGRVAERKIVSLLEQGAMVMVISPTLTTNLQALVQENRVKWKQAYYRKGDLAGSFLAIVATDDPRVGKACWEEATELGILINVADSVQRSSFLLPSVHRRGQFTITVSTEGKSPRLSKVICQSLANQYGEVYGQLTDLLGELRARALTEIKEEAVRRKLFEVLTEEGLQAIAEDRPLEAALWNLYQATIHQERGGVDENH